MCQSDVFGKQPAVHTLTSSTTVGADSYSIERLHRTNSPTVVHAVVTKGNNKELVLQPTLVEYFFDNLPNGWQWKRNALLRGKWS